MHTYLTADPHGQFDNIIDFLRENHNTILVILGDAGLNYYFNKRDYNNYSDYYFAGDFLVHIF